MKRLVAEVQRQDLVIGRWHVPKYEKGVLGCNTSSIASGVVLEVGGVTAD